jgi:hypothetical protein
MEWLAQVVAPSTNLGDYLISIGGPLGVIIIGLVIALVYYVRKADRLEKAINDEKDKRLQDAIEYSKLTLQPFKEFTDFVRTLYDGYNTRGKGR